VRFYNGDVTIPAATPVDNKTSTSTCNFGATPGAIGTNQAGVEAKGIAVGLRHIF